MARCWLPLLSVCLIIACAGAQELPAAGAVAVTGSAVEVPDTAAPVSPAANNLLEQTALDAAIAKMAAAAAGVPEPMPEVEATPANVDHVYDPAAPRPPRKADTTAVRAMSGPVMCTGRKKLFSYVYTWCGLAPTDSPPADTSDFVGVVDANPGSPTYGKLLRTVDTGFSWTEPHHGHIDKDGKWFAVGGLLSLLTASPDVFVFNTAVPDKPVLSHTLTLSKGKCVDEFRALSTGGFAASSLCGLDGGTGGGWFKIGGADIKNVTEYGPPATWTRANGKLTHFDPHGIDVDECNDLVITSDFFDVTSTIITSMNTAPKMISHSTVRVWRYSTGQLLSTIDLGPGNANGVMDTRRVPNSRGLAWVTNGLGHLYLINPYANGGLGSAKRVYCVDPACADVPGTCIQSNLWRQGTRMLLASYAYSQVRLLDTSNPAAIKTLDIFQMPPRSGGHVVKYDETTGIAAVLTYFLDIRNSQLGLNTTLTTYYSDRKLWLLRVVGDRLKFQATVDFNDAVPSKGPSNCHGLAINTGCA